MNRRNIIDMLKRVRSICTFYIAEQTPKHLESIRNYELSMAINFLSPNGRLLELGAGTGWQAQELHKLGYVVSAIDIPSSNYMSSRIYPVIDYDGKTIPFENNTFDIVFSSNVLEHIAHIYEFQDEIHRVLKPGGVVVHILPSSYWRFWSSLTEILKSWRPPLVHGEQARNVFEEIFYFSRYAWKRLFRKSGWEISKVQSAGLFYTGSSIMDSRLNISLRKKLSFILGSACNIYVLKNNAKE